MSTLVERLEREAAAHDYFAENADLRMTTGDHAMRAKKIRAIAAALRATTGEGEYHASLADDPALDGWRPEAPPPPLRDAGAVAVVIPNAVGVEIAWANPPSAGRPPVGTKLYLHPAPAQVDEAAVERAARALYTSQEYPLGWDEAEQGYRDVAYDLARTALTAAAQEKARE